MIIIHYQYKLISNGYLVEQSMYSVNSINIIAEKPYFSMYILLYNIYHLLLHYSPAHMSFKLSSLVHTRVQANLANFYTKTTNYQVQ